jgi:hypothetical protein
MIPAGENNPLGIGPRDPESSNTGSTADTSYNATGSPPRPTSATQENVGDSQPAADQSSPSRSRPADPETPSSDEP